jgi:hypothetical protein
MRIRHIRIEVTDQVFARVVFREADLGRKSVVFPIFFWIV